MNKNLNFNKVISQSLNYYQENWKKISLYSFYYVFPAYIINSLGAALASMGVLFSLFTNQEKLISIYSKIFMENGTLRETSQKLNDSDILLLLNQGLLILVILIIFAILVTVLSLPLLINSYDSILKLVEIKEVKYFSFNKKYFRIIITLFLQITLIVFGFLFFFLPGIYLTYRLYPMLLIAISEELTPIQTMNKAFELTKNNFWSIFLIKFSFVLVYIILLILVDIITQNQNLNNLFIIVTAIVAFGFDVLLDVNIYRILRNYKQQKEDYNASLRIKSKEKK